LKAIIKLIYRTPKAAKSICEAVSPDNNKVPKDLFIETSSTGNEIFILIIYLGNNLLTFQSTIDDILACISAAEKVCLAVRKQRDRFS
jgi:hypothetical protein